MTGKQTLIIDQSDFIKGMSSGAEISDGGFSNETEAVNLINTPGILYAPTTAVDSDTDARLTGGIIASSPDMVNFLGTNRLLIAANGSYYSYNGTKIPAAALQTDAVNTYVKGFTDIITYAGEAYVTSKQSIIRWQNPNTFNNSFYSFTNTSYPHPAIVFENNAYYGDNNLLLRQTSAGGAPTVILTLATDQVIIALGIDPSTGKLLISTTNSLSVSDTLSSINKILWYDGFSNKVSKSIIVENQVTAFYSHGGVNFVGYGTNIGYLNGLGITFLRKLANVSLDFTKLPYKHNFASIGKTLYIIDGNQILAYGEIIEGAGKKFYYCYLNRAVNSNIFDCIFSGGNNKLGLCFATNKFYTLDVTSVSSIDRLNFVSNWYMFQRPIVPRAIFIEYAGTLASSAHNTISYQNQDRTAGKGLVPLDGTITSTTQIRNIVGFLPEEITMIKFTIVNATGNTGIKRIIFYYDYAE